MASAEPEEVIFVKDDVCGTIFLIIDNQNPVTISFRHSIKVKVKLGIIKPECRLEAVCSQSHPGQFIHASWDNGTFEQDDDSTCDDVSDEKDLPINDRIIFPSADVVNVTKTGEELDEPLTESRENSVLSNKNPHKFVGFFRKNVSVINVAKEAKKTSHSNSEESGSSSQRKTFRASRRRRLITSEPKKVQTGRKQSKNGKSLKSNSIKEIVLPTSTKKDEAKDSLNYNIQADQSKEKRSAKWKLARQVSCQYCLRVFENQQEFYDHKKTSRSEIYKCLKCTKVFPFQAHLQAHVKAFHQEGKLFSNLKQSASCICDDCGCEVKNMFALKKHLMLHTQEYFYSCCICGKKFVEPGTLNNHMITHKSGGMIRCKCCDQLFATRSALAKHKLASLEVKCHLCGEVFPNRTSRTQHYKVFHQNDILKCSQCTSMFSSTEELAVHMKKHNLYKKKLCKICGQFFSRLEKHIVTHKAKTEIDESELFVCDKCPKKFTNRSSFQRHLTIHSQDKPYQCPNCPRKFADCGVLRKHLRRHLSLMPYECKVCGKKCKEPGNLKVHMRIHSDTKQFQCSVCPQAFNYKSSLEGHMRSRHSQNLSATSLLPVAPEVRQEFENRVDPHPHQMFRPTHIDPGPNQLCKSDSWKMEQGPCQTFVTTSHSETKQYYDSKTDTYVKSFYDSNGVHPVSLMARHTYHVQPIHVDPINLNVSSKPTFVQSTAGFPSECAFVNGSASLSTAYARDGNPVSQHHDDSSANVTSLDITTLNVSSMNISLY